MQNLKTSILSVFIIVLLSMNFNIKAQMNDWETKILDDGKLSVKYKISERMDEKGNTVPLIEDYTTITETLDFQKCIAFMKDVSRHKEFTGDEISKKVKTISDSECIVYYYTNNPWPVANSDCVARMVYSFDETKKTAVFKLTGAPSEYKKGDVGRMTYYNVSFSFIDLGKGKVQIIETGKNTPPVKVPAWVIRSAFPKVPADAMRKLVEAIKEDS